MTQISLFLLAIAAALAACGNPPDKSQLVLDGKDSLFLGYWLGMPRDSFYEHSLALNRKGLVMQGPQNQHIQYKLDSTLAYQATMLFYPDFYDGKVARMRLRFSYDAWAPWNKFLHADSLLPDVVGLMTAWYGKGFEEHIVSGPYGNPTVEYTKVDVRRRIIVGVLDDIEVGVLLTDLEAEQRMAAARDEAE